VKLHFIAPVMLAHARFLFMLKLNSAGAKLNMPVHLSTWSYSELTDV
jgi:hypothetical protein